MSGNFEKRIGDLEQLLARHSMQERDAFAPTGVAIIRMEVMEPWGPVVVAADGEGEGDEPETRDEELSRAAEQARIDQLVAYVTDGARQWRQPFAVSLVIWEEPYAMRYTVPWRLNATWLLETLAGGGNVWPPDDADRRERR